VNDDFESVIAQLEAERDRLTATIEHLRSVAGKRGGEQHEVPSPIGPPIEVQKAPRDRIGPGVLRDDQFFGMTMRQAVRECLSVLHRPMTATEISYAIKTHGLPSDHKAYANSIYTALYREQKAGTVVTVPPGKKWALAAWYPHLKRAGPKAKAAGADGASPTGDEPSEPEPPS
jgi:hypothetical protein